MKKQNSRKKLLDVTFDEIYIHGYAATSIDAILKKAGVPKGSMYHHFDSKKALVITMVKERLFPKIETFFAFNKSENETVTQHLRQLYAAMSKNETLIRYGCPLYRLMVELSPVDEEFDRLLGGQATKLQKNLSTLLQSGIEEREFTHELKSEPFAKFMLSATWGILSLPPSLSSSRSFVNQIRFIFEKLESYRH